MVKSRFSQNTWSLVPRVNYSLKQHKYVCITTYQTDTKSNPDHNPNPNPTGTTRQHAIVSIQLNIVTCPTYPDKFIRDMLLHRLCDFRLELSHCLHYNIGLTLVSNGGVICRWVCRVLLGGTSAGTRSEDLTVAPGAFGFRFCAAVVRVKPNADRTMSSISSLSCCVASFPGGVFHVDSGRSASSDFRCDWRRVFQLERSWRKKTTDKRSTWMSRPVSISKVGMLLSRPMGTQWQQTNNSYRRNCCIKGKVMTRFRNDSTDGIER